MNSINKFFCVGLASLILIGVIASGKDDKSKTSSTFLSGRFNDEQIVQVLEEEIRWYATTGVKEGYDGRFYCKWGNKAFGSSIGEQYAWCATFVSYMMIEKFHVFSDVKSSGFLSRSVSELMSGGKKEKIYYSSSGYTPQVGDIVIQKNGKSHTGIYIGDGVMVAGNTSNTVKKQKIASGLSGFIHVDYVGNIASQSIQLNGKGIPEKMWNYMISNGFSKEATAGVLGNADGETGFNPKYDVSVGASRGYGIFCMTDQRAAAMRNYSRKKYGDQYSIEGQLEFFVMYDAPEQFKKYTGKTYQYSNGVITWWPKKMTFKEYGKLTDIKKATEIFMRVYERPGIPHLNRRILSAQKYYNKFK